MGKRKNKNCKGRTGAATKDPQYESSRKLINSDLQDKEEHKHDNSGGITVSNIHSSNTRFSQNRKENSTNDEKDNSAQEPQHGLSSEVNDDLHDKEEEANEHASAVTDRNIDRSNSSTSRRKKKNANRKRLSKYQCDEKDNMAKVPLDEQSTCKMDIDLHDDVHKLDYAGCVPEGNVDGGSNSSFQRKKEKSTNNNNRYDRKQVGAKGYHHGYSTTKMDIDLSDDVHKLDYAGCVPEGNVDGGSNSSFQRKKEKSTNNNNRYDRKQVGAKGYHHGFPSSEMKADSHERNIQERKSKDYQQPNRKEFRKSVVREIKGDLFMAPTEYSLAHCVAADMRMGSGIATTFRQNFKRVDELLAQKKRPGDVAVLYIEEQNRFIYYLVTKFVSNGKPHIDDLERSLVEMKRHIKENNVHKLAMPRIGCGLDRLEWSDVLPMIEWIFKDIEIDIVVYDFNQSIEEKLPTKNNNNVYIRHKKMNLVDIEPGTAYIFIGSINGFVDSTIESLDRKFHIIEDYKRNIKKLGEVIRIEKRDYFYGLIARDDRQSISYKDLGRCLQALRKIIDRNYFYIGFEAFFDSEDIIATNKVVTLISNYLNKKFEVWVCWPDSVILKIPDMYCPYFSQ